MNLERFLTNKLRGRELLIYNPKEKLKKHKLRITKHTRPIFFAEKNPFSHIIVFLPKISEIVCETWMHPNKPD
jgi:hypothetical protein